MDGMRPVRVGDGCAEGEQDASRCGKRSFVRPRKNQAKNGTGMQGGTGCQRVFSHKQAEEIRGGHHVAWLIGYSSGDLYDEDGLY